MDSKDTAQEQYALDPADYYLERAADTIHVFMKPQPTWRLDNLEYSSES
jgi:hypothetical protein